MSCPAFRQHGATTQRSEPRGDIFIPAGEELKMKHRFEDEEL
jgi:hypothetical protein